MLSRAKVGRFPRATKNFRLFFPHLLRHKPPHATNRPHHPPFLSQPPPKSDTVICQNCQKVGVSAYSNKKYP